MFSVRSEIVITGGWHELFVQFHETEDQYVNNVIL